MNKALLALLAIFLFTHLTGLAQNKQLQCSKEPSWATITSINYSNIENDEDAEDGYLDVDFEKQVNLAEQSTYFKCSYLILTDAGVQNKSELSILFDPSYEQLILHNIRIIRRGNVINKLQLSKIKTIQQETELSRHIYNGNLTALLLLDDVRKGDVIEYSYTIKGFNPIFNNKYADVYTLKYSVPINRLLYRCIVPAGRKLQLKNKNQNATPSIQNINGQTVYEWKAENVKPLRAETTLPGWYNPYPEVEVSEFSSWQEISRWAVNLFPSNTPLSPSLKEKITQIEKQNVTDEQRVLAALRFVQDEVRYMGIEFGESSHRPNNPNKIFAQRFGDCKDKSYLLATILRALKIDATPVLVNTSAKKALAEYLPTPHAFDHCTVRVTVNNKQYWFDPTISFQRGKRLEDIYYPDYQAALVINNNTTAISTIPFHHTGKQLIKEYFTVDKSFSSTTLKVITTYTGSYADDIRDQVSNNSVFELKKNYKDFYKNYFDNIQIDSLSYVDNEDGSFQTNEYYSIEKLWKANGGLHDATFFPYIIETAMRKPKEESRTMPYSLTYPASFVEDIEVTMPDTWYPEDYNSEIACAGFRFVSTTTHEGKKVFLHYEYETLKDHILPAETAEYIRNYKLADDSIGYHLTYSKNNGTVHYEPVTYVGGSGSVFPKLYFLLGVCVLITFLNKQRKKQREQNL